MQSLLQSNTDKPQLSGLSGTIFTLHVPLLRSDSSNVVKIGGGN